MANGDDKKAKEKKEAEAKQKAQDEINFRKSAISTIEKLATDNKRLNEEALRNKKKTTKGTKPKRKPILARLKNLGEKPKVKKKTKFKGGRKLLAKVKRK